MELASKEKNISEFNVTVPWGHIAVKAWGNKSDEHVLVVHGRMDNAGAFDRLIPLLPNSYYYVCIDLPGHGKSSHFPPHLPLYTLNYIIVYRLLMQHFQRKRYIILGHSYGGQIGLLYSRLYPDIVDKLIMLDAIHTYPVPIKSMKKILAESFIKHIETEKKHRLGQPPVYSYKEALERIRTNRETGAISLPAAQALLKRALIKVGEDKYHFSLDQRMKNYLDILHDFRYAVESLENDPVSCPTLMLLAKENVYQNNYMQPVLSTLKKFRNVKIHFVDGGHDVHNTDPEVMALLINKFLMGINTGIVGQNEQMSYLQKVFRFLKNVKILR